MPIKSINPATGEVIKEYTELTSEQIKQKLEIANQAFLSWRALSMDERSKYIQKLADYLQANHESMAKVLTEEEGKTWEAGSREIEKCALTCEYYAESAAKLLQNEDIKTVATHSYVRFDPLGVVLAVMPWNFPYWQVYRSAAPALMAGNTMVLKHASNVPGCAEEIQKTFDACGFPEGVFTNLPIGSDKVEEVIVNPHVKMVILTGSEGAGASVASIAGKNLKKTVLELGGSDPFIVMADADLETASDIGLTSRLSSNAGQVCNSAKRFIVHESVADKFTDLMKKKLSELKLGDPTSPDTKIGPLSSKAGLDKVVQQVNDSVKAGAKVEMGGKQFGEVGYFYEPTVLTNIKKDMTVFAEEVFGPVISIMTFKTDEEAIEIANDTPYGLGATIFTQDTTKGETLAQKIEAGNVFINAQVRSDPRTPFGGIKRSGYGRELGSYGIKEFTNIKTVWVK